MTELTINDIFTRFTRDYGIIKFLLGFSIFYLGFNSILISFLGLICEWVIITIFYIGLEVLIIWLKIRKIDYPREATLLQVEEETKKVEINEDLAKSINMILDKIKNNYQLDQLLNFCLAIIVPILFMNLILSSISLYQIIMLNYVLVNYNSFMIYQSVFLGLNLFIFILQVLRFIDFRVIRQINSTLEKAFGDKIDECINKMDEIINTNINELSIDDKELTGILMDWNELYQGTYFNSRSSVLKISDFKDLLFIEDEERYYYYLISTLKSRIQDYKFHNPNKDVHTLKEILENILQKLDNEIKVSESILKNKRERIKMISTWFRVVSSPLSLFLTLFYFFSGIF